MDHAGDPTEDPQGARDTAQRGITDQRPGREVAIETELPSPYGCPAGTRRLRERGPGGQGGVGVFPRRTVVQGEEGHLLVWGQIG